ncbi:MAG: hypothetical protein HDT23_04440, partial [Ruminococcus sp.]|nr:hypothetical protein [Ruminococcus sp.]
MSYPSDDYKMIVKGKKKDCYAFNDAFNESNHHDYQNISYERGSDEDYEICFEGMAYSCDNIAELSEKYGVDVMYNYTDAEYGNG